MSSRWKKKRFKKEKFKSSIQKRKSLEGEHYKKKKKREKSVNNKK